MIHNLKELATTEVRAHVLQILEAGLSAAMPETAIKQAVSFDGHTLRVGRREFRPKGRIVVIGFGKASVRMAKAVEDLLGSAIDRGAVISPFEGQLERIEVLVGTHPLPSERNVKAARRLVKLAEGLGEGDLLLVLISGGGSALFSLPVEGVTIEEKAIVSSQLMRAGADIYELNAVRKHISRVKGGRLSKIAWPATLVSLIVSDVVGDRLDTIASGPTAPDETTFTDALEAIQMHGIQAPESIVSYLRRGIKGEVEETPKPGDSVFSRTHNFIVAGNLKSLRTMAKRAQELGYKPFILTSRLVGEAREVAKAVCSVLLSCRVDGEPFKPPACLIAGGETTVTVMGNGVGGRNQELALAACIEIKGHNIVLASMGSDGIDGTSDAAGALVDGNTARRAREKGLDPKAFLRGNDSHTFFKKVGGTIYTGPTGTNVNDFIIGLVP